MKITKFRLAVSVLLIATVIYGVMYVVEANHYYSQIEDPIDDPILGRIFVTVEPFSQTHEGRLFLAGGLGFLVLWCLAIYPPNLWKRKKVVALMLLLPLSLTMLKSLFVLSVVCCFPIM